MSASDHHSPGREGGGPQAAAQLHVRRGGGGGPGQDTLLP